MKIELLPVRAKVYLKNKDMSLSSKDEIEILWEGTSIKIKRGQAVIATLSKPAKPVASSQWKIFSNYAR